MGADSNSAMCAVLRTMASVVSTELAMRLMLGTASIISNIANQSRNMVVSIQR